MRPKSKVEKTISFLIIVMLIMFFKSAEIAFAQEKTEKAVVLKVQPKTVAMPGNKVSKVPLRYARIRSTELRELIKQYDLDGTATIEKVYEWKQIGNNPAELVEVEDTYILRFSADVDVDTEALIDAQKELPVVVNAEQPTTAQAATTEQTATAETKQSKKEKKQKQEQQK